MEFQRRLTNAWSVRAYHVAKRRVIEVAVYSRWSEELCVIESIESLQAEFE